MLP
ncbi:hypothetical protein CP8484711_2280A, partial [Chlamydia psittaci 84-8471/1]|jgi:lysozyme family protein